MNPLIIAPQPGPQTKAMSSPADVIVMGGSAGGGKSRWLIMEAARYFKTRDYGAVIFRKTFPEITNQGGLWDESGQVYPHLGAVPRESDLDWRWPEFNSSVSFAHMQHVKNKEQWRGSQVPLIGVDEAPQFEEEIFWWLLSRNRSTCGVKPCMRLTCNPAPDTWIHRLVDWYIGDDGYALPERDGVLRYFARQGDELVWDSHPHDDTWKSFTFIRARLEDNPALTDVDPSYRASLMALPLYERTLLLDGNWTVRRDRGMRFKREWFKVERDVAPIVRCVRYWDRASTEPGPQNRDPDWTAGVLMGQDAAGGLWILDVVRIRGTPATVLRTIDNTAALDSLTYAGVELWLEQDPGQAGVAERDMLAKELSAYAPRFLVPSGSKWTRSAPASAAAEVGRIKIKGASWTSTYINELETFVDEGAIKPPPGYKDDQVDATSGALHTLTSRRTPGIRAL